MRWQMAKTKSRTLDMTKINYNDADVLEYIGTGKTDGIFQLESGGDERVHERIKAP